jgi:thymidylate synthase
MNYKEIVQNVLDNGSRKIPVRDGEKGRALTETIATFCEVFRHDMSEGFPLSTLRKLPWKSIRVELQGFIKGITDKSWYQDRGCHFWDEWASPEAVTRALIEWQCRNVNLSEDYKEVVAESSKKEGEYKEKLKDLGPIYGYQWRCFNQHHPLQVNRFQPDSRPGDPKGVDQLKRIVDTLKRNPTDRRMLCSAWNPNQMHLMALPPCHFAWYVSVIGGKLNLVWFQRSCDVALGLPANIASYGLLLELLAREAGLPAGELVGILADCHIYENQIEPINELIERDENELPTLRLRGSSIWDWGWSDAELIGYNPHPSVKMGEVEV